MKKEMWDNIEKLSELRSHYSCFDEQEQPYYHALSLGIEGIKAIEQESILDKIRAEIEQLLLHKAQFITSDSKLCVDSQEVLNIIDKYKSESEDK